MDNCILIQNVSLDDLERMIDKAVERRINEFYGRIQKTSPVLLKRKEAAKRLGVSLPTIDSYAKAGLLHAMHVGGRVFFDEKEIQAFAGLG